MKKILEILMLIMVIVLTGCDNNKGPFETRKEKGNTVLYSNGKPTKGGVISTITNLNGDNIIISEIYYDKGIPAGNFILRDTNGYVLADAKGKWNESDKFEGTVNSDINNILFGEYKVISKGIYNIDKNYLITYKGNNLFLVLDFLIDGEYQKYENDILTYECSKRNNKILKDNHYYIKSGNIASNALYDSNGRMKTQTEYYENGQVFSTYKNSDDGESHEHIKYYENGQIDLLSIWIKNKETESKKYYENGNLASSFMIRDDKLIERVEYYENGLKKSELIKNYDDNFNGDYCKTEWDNTGKIKKFQKYIPIDEYDENYVVNGSEIRYKYLNRGKSISIVYNGYYNRLSFSTNLASYKEVIESVLPELQEDIEFLIELDKKLNDEKILE